MKTFTDNAGRAWTLALTIGAAKRVKSLLGVNLLELEAGDPPLLTRRGTDVILLCDAIFALVKPQADAAGVTDEQFAAAMGGDAILATCQTAFYEELVDFSASWAGATSRRPWTPATDDRPGGAADRDADRPAGPRSGHRDDPWRTVYELAAVVEVNPGPLTPRASLDGRGPRPGQLSAYVGGSRRSWPT